MTAQHIERLEAVGRITTEILLIDNASPYPKSYRGCTTIRFDKNRGVAAAWNAGALAATGDILCFLNNDVWVEPGWDTGLCEAAGDGRRIAFPYTDHGDRKGFRCPDTAGVAGWCFALTRSVWEEIGPFDEAFGPAFYEDTDFFTRAWRLGIDLCPVPDANVHHRRRTSANQLPDVDSLFQANKQRYALKYGLDSEAVPPYYARRIVQYRSGRFA
jgi:GT2 family glycosyltransferase